MSRLPIVLLVLLLGIIAGVIATQVLGPSKARHLDDSQATQLTPSGRSPAFHLDLSPADRLIIAKACIAKLSAGQAGELGALKDDLALLSFDPAVRRLILDAYEERPRLTRFEGAAFCDIFALIRDPGHIGPVRNLLQDPELAVRQKAIHAAIVNADPSLCGFVDRVYADFDGIYPNQGLHTRLSFLEAARRCGGDHAALVFDRALKDTNGEIRATAADNLAAMGMKSMADRIVPLLEDSEGGVRLKAAWALRRLGRSEGDALLLEGLEPSQPVFAQTCAQAIIDTRFQAALPRLRELLPKASTDLRPSFVFALTLLGDLETLASMRKALNDPSARLEDRLTAISSLGPLCLEEDKAVLRKIASSPDAVLTSALASSLGASVNEPDLEIVIALVRGRSLTHPAQLAGVATRLGDKIVDALDEALKTAELPADVAVGIGGLGAVGTPKARAALVRHRTRHRALIDQQIRLFDLENRKLGRQE